MSHPTFWQVARRPQWIAALLLVMAVAAIFAFLGKWQLERAVISGQSTDHQSETVVPLSSLAKPGGIVNEVAAGHMVSVIGGVDRTSLVVLSDRMNGGQKGYWLVARAFTQDGVLADALGWAPTLEAVTAVRDRMAGEIVDASMHQITGRFMPSEAPAVPRPDQNPFSMSTMSVPALFNVWSANDQGIYTGYLVDATAPEGLVKIDSTPPVSDSTYNWLNIFYAMEWVVFAGFAFYVWYRLVRDRRERELEENALTGASNEQTITSVNRGKSALEKLAVFTEVSPSF